MDDKTVRKAMDVIAQAMLDDNPSKKGSYAHSWHCRIANMCLDAIEDAELERDNYSEGINSYAVANDAASRVLKLLFDIDAKYLSDVSTVAKG
jgi:hypothetical protein